MYDFKTEHKAFSTNSGDDINEGTPLLQTNNKKNRIKIAVITVGIFATTIAATIAYFATRHRQDNNSGSNSSSDSSSGDIPIHHDQPKLSFHLEVPQQGTGKLIIHNEGNWDVEVVSVQFSTSANIKEVPTGNLAPSGASLQELGTEGIWMKYKLTEPSNQKIFIRARSSRELLYRYSQSLTLVNVATLPKDISVTTIDSNYAVALANQCQNLTCNDPFPGKIVGGFYQDDNMLLRQFNVTNINPRQLNHIYYSPLNFDAQGNVYLANEIAASVQLPLLMQMQQQYPYLKVNLSFGGKDSASNFHYIINNLAAKTKFINNVATLLNQYNLSGVEINWSTPSQNDGVSLPLFLHDINQQINSNGTSLELSYAGPTTPEGIRQLGYRVFDISQQINTLNLNAYHYRAATSDYQAPYSLPPNDPNGQGSSVTSAISTYVHYLFPIEKIVLGVTTDELGYKVATMNNNGVWQQITGAPVGQFNDTGIYDYACVTNNTCYNGNPIPSDCQYLSSSQAFMGNFSLTPLVICPTNQFMFTGESVSSVQVKATYAMNSNLKGILFSNLGADLSGNESLLNAADEIMLTHLANSSREMPVLALSEEQWQKFVADFNHTLMYSFAGGMGFAALFQIINSLTEQLLSRFISKDKAKMMDVTVYYSLKTSIYLTTLYVIGAPFLPSLAGNFVALTLEKLLDCENKESLLAGTSASFLLNLSNSPELHSPQGIAYAIFSFLTSLGGSLSFGFLSKNWSTFERKATSIFNTALSFFGSPKNPRSAPVDVELDETLNQKI